MVKDYFCAYLDSYITHKNPKIPNITAKIIYGNIYVISIINLNIITIPDYLLETSCYFSVYLVTFVVYDSLILILS